MIEDLRPPFATGHDKDGVIGIFYFKAVHDRKASAIEGQPVYVTRPRVRVVVPGQPKSTWEGDASPEMQKRWPEAWAKFRALSEGEEFQDGTPLNQWPQLTVAEVARLCAIGVHTVEALASVSDSNLSRLGPSGRALRERARQFVSGPGETERDLRARIAELESESRALKGQLGSLKVAIDQYQAKFAETEPDDEALPEPAPAPVGKGRNGKAKSA